MKILVVDDEKLLVKGIKFNLENDGYEVVTGSDGVEAVEIASSQTVDLIILDLMMPRMDGLEACQRIREFSDVPIMHGIVANITIQLRDFDSSRIEGSTLMCLHLQSGIHSVQSHG